MKIVEVFLKQGIQVLQLRKNDKAPAISGWNKPENLMPWETEGKELQAQVDAGEAGLGILCGSFSGVIAIDIDSDDPEDIKVVTDCLGMSPYAKKGKRGVTFFYAYNGETYTTIEFTSGNGHIDVLSDNKNGGGRNTVLPPSIHPDTMQPYVWCGEQKGFNKAKLTKITKEQWDCLFASDKVVGNKLPAAQTTTSKTDYIKGKYQNASGIKEVIEKSLKRQDANMPREEWIRLAYSVNYSLTGQEGYDLFKAWSDTADTAEYDHASTERQLNDVFFSDHASLGGSGQITAATLFKSVDGRTTSTLSDVAVETLNQIKMDYSGASLATAVKGNTLPAIKYDYSNLPEIENSFSNEELVERFLQRYGHLMLRAEGLQGAKETQFYDEETGRYIPCSTKSTSAVDMCCHKLISEMINSDGFKASCKDDNGIFDPLKYRKKINRFLSIGFTTPLTNRILTKKEQFTQVDSKDIDKVPSYLKDANDKVVDMTTGQVVDCPPSVSYIPNKLKAVYNPNARCPKFEQFMGEIFANNEEPEKYLEVMQMFAGYLASGGIEQSKVYMLTGSGANGKSAWLSFIRGALGEYAGQLSSIGLQQSKYSENSQVLEKKMYETSYKRLAFFGDTPADLIISEAMVKAFTEDEVQVKKLYADIERIPNRCKMLMCLNEMPELSSGNEGVTRRIQVIPFNRSFMNLDTGERARKAVEFRQTAEEERSGILNYIIKGYQMYLANDSKLDFPADAMESTEEYLEEACPEQTLIKTFCGDPRENIKSSSAFIRPSDLAPELCRFMRSEGYLQISAKYDENTSGANRAHQAIGRKLSVMGYEKRRTRNGVQYRAIPTEKVSVAGDKVSPPMSDMEDFS